MQTLLALKAELPDGHELKVRHVTSNCVVLEGRSRFSQYALAGKAEQEGQEEEKGVALPVPFPDSAGGCWHRALLVDS